MVMTNKALIEEAGRRLAATASEAKVILFGPRARGEGRQDGELDLLVIQPDFARRGEEYGRLRKELRGLEVAINLEIYRAARWTSGAKCRAAFFTECLPTAASSRGPDLLAPDRGDHDVKVAFRSHLNS
jgi:predicted nucleotidyltransferase